jgi:hypothetical protein
MIEPILKENDNRFVIFQLNTRYFDMYLTKKAAMWTVEEIDLSKILNIGIKIK